MLSIALIDKNPGGPFRAKNSAERFVAHSIHRQFEGDADMNPPRLIRPLRPLIQGQLVWLVLEFLEIDSS